MGYSREEIGAKLDENMPSLSPTTAKVVQLANNLNTPPAELTRVIKLDPVLSAKAMKLVNSSYFGLSNHIVSLEKATIMLGLNTIKNLALGAAVLTQMKDNGSSLFCMDAFWKHSLAVGAAGKLIAKKRNVDKKQLEEYFIAGLLHDLGLLVESKIYPDELGRALEVCKEVGLVEAEEFIMEESSHCVAGEALGARWNLSEQLVEVMRYHHRPFDVENPSTLTVTVHLADAICQNANVGLVLNATPMEIAPKVYECLDIDPASLDDIPVLLEGEIAKATEFLKA